MQAACNKSRRSYIHNSFVSFKINIDSNRLHTELTSERILSKESSTSLMLVKCKPLPQTDKPKHMIFSKLHKLNANNKRPFTSSEATKDRSRMAIDSVSIRNIRSQTRLSSLINNSFNIRFPPLT